MNAASARPGGAKRWQINASYVAALGMIVCFAAVLLQFLSG